MDESCKINLSYQGKTSTLENITLSTTGNDLHELALQTFQLSSNMIQLKVLLKGKRVDNSEKPIFKSLPKKTPKAIIMATSLGEVSEIVSKRSDPTIRGFYQEKTIQEEPLHWGKDHTQDKNFKFCRFQACTWQSFGHRPTEQTPHAFAAMSLLEKLSKDPGIVAIMKERELVVGTLGEMDPIDDRLMQIKEEHGGCLLGYNTNAGLRIDIKLRTDDLQGFRPYPVLVSTLIHELSHNWVSDHSPLFWANYAQMRAEYINTHSRLRSTIVKGKTTAELAGLDKSSLGNVFDFVMSELVEEMAQHGLHPRMIESPIRQRCEELKRIESGVRLGEVSPSVGRRSAKEKALLAAERRAKKHERKKKGS